MKCTITSKDIKLSEDDKQYISEKLIATVNTYFDDTSTTVDVVLKDINGPKGGVDKEVDVVLVIPHHKNPIKVTENGQYVRETIDKAEEKLDKVLRRIKDRLQDHHRSK